ncbi:hypothetical protein [Nocardiopsis dassonvillei]|uniref:hypothetical protein n=1 Tax=Nocardiopsis dassonvillei TaxID=2014 RepID=UPI00157C3F12|nr:hypothetical protein [Nocardiopsis dassonvillei]
MTTASRFAASLATLTAAHHVGDYLAQTDHQSACKPAASDRGDVVCSEGESWRALAGHIASYHAVQAAGLLVANRALGLKLRPGRVAAGIAVSAATHALVDRRRIVRWLMDNTGSADFRQRGGAAHVDQALHHACLWVAALVMAGGKK